MGSGAMEDDVDSGGHSIGDKLDGDGHRGLGVEDAEDKDDDEDDVSLLPRRSERDWNRGRKGKRSRCSPSGRDSTAKRQRHLH